MNTTFLQTGTNLGDRLSNLKKSLSLLEEHLKIEQVSKVFESEAWGVTDQPNFLNQVIKASTNQTPSELLQTLLKIEQNMGRVREQKWGSRLIDIDILFFNLQVVSHSELSIPHPEIQNRKFVLVPLNQLAPGFIHPKLNKSISTLLEECEDETRVWEYTS